MTEPRLAETSSRAARIQDALNNIGSWLLDVVSVDPGWSEMVLDVKPLAGQIFVRVREFRDGEEFIGTIGPLKDGSPIIAEVRKLQRAAYDGNRGTWFTASIVVAATGWPNPQFSVGASYNRDDEPASWKNEGTLTATDVREHLAEFPRDASRIPQWARERMEG
ncbi:MAG: SseB family protein, partial [Rothia mucilaginosa]